MTETARTDFYALEDLLTAEEIDVRDRVADWCAKEVTPRINDYWERAEFPFELVPGFAALGIAGGTVQGYGSPGMSCVAAGLVAAELARAALATLSERHAVPVENLLSPDLVRRLMWSPPEQRDAGTVAAALRAGGAREWQIELTRDLLAEAVTAA